MREGSYHLQQLALTESTITILALWGTRRDSVETVNGLLLYAIETTIPSVVLRLTGGLSTSIFCVTGGRHYPSVWVYFYSQFSISENSWVYGYFILNLSKCDNSAEEHPD